jgi:two-component system, NtrC family, sensor kinase
MSARSYSLSLKLSLCLIGSMVITFLILGYQIVQLHRRHLEEMTFASADRISDTIKRSTRYSMLQNHRDELYHTIKTIGAEPGINKIRIFNQEGKISFSTDASEMSTLVDKKAEACTVCHAQEEPLTRLNRPDRMRIYTGQKGGRVLGLINPIENELVCSDAPCHAHPAEKQVLGVLDVTLSLARVDETIAEGSHRMKASFLVAVLIIPLILGVPVWFMVHKPVTQLILGTKRVAAGDLDYRIDVSSSDEIGELAISFNHMTDELKQADQQITKWARTLESRVEEKTLELKKTHEQMIHVERMASIGKLAAIVAHEINNPISGILTYAKLLLKKMKNQGLEPSDVENAKQYLEVIASESARCGDIVKNLLQFARQTAVNLQPNDVNELLRQSIRLVQHKIDLMNMQIHLQLGESLPVLICDAQLMRQALLALLINACEAMTAGEGALEVMTRFCPEQERVEIRIHDNGVGMDEQTQHQIFEPFFTTKDHGKGVGLGLAVVYGIVSQHSGKIDVQSSPGQGTTFTIRLPVSPPVPAIQN